MAKKNGELTPMMKQFFDFKAKYPEALLLFRCGDFYETYCDDAVIAAQILGITLTHRNNGAGVKGDEMAGFPHHALDTYLPKLIRAGRRVAICDQLEDPKLAKKLVKRGITELVTPGVAMSDTVLNYKENNFLCAVHFGKAACGVAFLDISTGEFLTGEGTYDYVEKLIGNFQPKEVLYNRERRHDFERYFGTRLVTFLMDDWVFTEQTAHQKLYKHFNVKSLKGFGVDHLRSGVVAAGAILQYLEQTLHTQIAHITSLTRIEEERYVRLDKFTVRSLELVQPMQEDGKSLLDVIDRTVSPMGGRLLRRWLVFPLKDEKPINERLDVVEYFFREPAFRQCIDDQLHEIGDLERIVSKIATGRVTPREMVQLRRALQATEPIKQACLAAGATVAGDSVAGSTASPASAGFSASSAAPVSAGSSGFPVSAGLPAGSSLQRVGERLSLCEALRDRISREIENDPPQQVQKGGVIRSGVSEELDELRRIAYSGKDYLLQIQEREAQQTGIASLKIGYNNVFGYYLEVRNTYKDKVPQEWVRKQTLAQAERYITQELKEYEEKILGAEDKILSLEQRLFNDLVVAAQEFIAQIQQNANVIAHLDCLLSAAKAAEENHYVRPTVSQSEVIDIRQGRHPVIETQLPVGERYVPNDILLDQERQQIIIITGPNMAGKSALLRQTALIVLMAQIGCFVPAEAAHIGLVDKIFTRVGASDNISLGESTFMVEMTEASNILNNVTPRSLVLFDELGRGTSTYDGISIAWAIVEYLHEHPKAQARTLFATHYHELNEMEKHFARIKNYNVSVKEVDGKVIFLRKLEKGGSEHSFGIHVAEIAGMPKSIVKRAGVILKQLESDNAQVGSVGKPTAEIAQSREGMQLSFFQLDDPVLCQIRDEILGLDINNLTPMEALNKLNDIKRIVSGK
ncbi:MAG: DNA mismatch repair protein MutS [Prevotella sp.]|nr:DNA mismatch repair protein MutS [Prevotella sp.]